MALCRVDFGSALDWNARLLASSQEQGQLPGRNI